MVQQAEISPAGAGAVTIERTSHVVETDGSVYDTYTLTATANQGYKFSRYEVRLENSYSDGSTRLDDGTWEIRNCNGLIIDNNLMYEEMMKIMKEECEELNKEEEE